MDTCHGSRCSSRRYTRLPTIHCPKLHQLSRLLRAPSCCSAPSLLSTLMVIVQDVVINGTWIFSNRPCVKQLFNPEAHFPAPYARQALPSRRLLHRPAIVCGLGRRHYALGSGTVRRDTGHARRICVPVVAGSTALICSAAAGYTRCRAYASFADKGREEWLRASWRCW